jgi:hypothetical protein
VFVIVVPKHDEDDNYHNDCGPQQGEDDKYRNAAYNASVTVHHSITLHLGRITNFIL